MSESVVEADYLVVGAGAMGMAFVDTLLTDSDATVAIVDRHHQPGGHWNLAYPFVRLHQPSSFYGVSSRPLGSNMVDAAGLNKGLYELASRGEICTYFDQLMQQRFLPSGRVEYYPMCEYLGAGRFVSRVSNHTSSAKAKRTVDATYMDVRVPAMGSPTYSIEEGATCVPLNALPNMAGPNWRRYVVVGAGKTGMDACLFLLSNGIDPDRISWIMPRDSWIQDRANFQIGNVFEHTVANSLIDILRSIVSAESVDEMFVKLEACGQLIRIDERQHPTMWRCATVTQTELELLRRITHVVREGRVNRIGREVIELEKGRIATNSQTLHIDCTADGLARRDPRPVFDGDLIRLQSVRTCQQVFSASFIAHVEAKYHEKNLKNELCTVVPHPDTTRDYLTGLLIDLSNAARWAVDPELQEWVKSNRLDWLNKSVPSANKEEDMTVLVPRVLENLQKLIAELP